MFTSVTITASEYVKHFAATKDGIIYSTKQGLLLHALLPAVQDTPSMAPLSTQEVVSNQQSRSLVRQNRKRHTRR